MLTKILTCCSLLDNNDLFCNMSPEILEFKTISEVQVDEKQLSKGAQSLSCKEGSFSRYVGSVIANSFSYGMSSASSC